jgi:hypothetical protein
MRVCVSVYVDEERKSVKKREEEEEERKKRRKNDFAQTSEPLPPPSFPSFLNYVGGGVQNASVRVGNSERSSSERRSFGDGTRHRVQGEQQLVVVVVVVVSRFENCVHRVRHEPTKVKGEERNGLLRVEN